MAAVPEVLAGLLPRRQFQNVTYVSPFAAGGRPGRSPTLRRPPHRTKGPTVLGGGWCADAPNWYPRRVAFRARAGYNALMNRTAAPIGALLALLLLVGASVLAAPSQRDKERAPVAEASHAAESSDQATDPESGAAPSQQLLDRIVSRLEGVGISTDADAVAALAKSYGVGGAVRLLAWANAAGMTTDEIAAMFDGGTGWGQIVRKLNDADSSLSLHPGIGWVMCNGHGGGSQGLGRSGAPGQQKKQ